MDIHNVGPCALDDCYDLNELLATAEKYEWAVYWYESGCYDGSGECVALGKDGLIYSKDLSHCSCYGPMEGWATGTTKITVEEFLRDKDSIFDYDCMEAIKLKVRCLLDQQK